MLISVYVCVYSWSLTVFFGTPRSSTTMHCSPLNRLPHEIQLIIIHFCGRAEQKTLRCCCKALNAYVLPVLYPTVFVDILSSSRSRVNNIANKAEIGYHVRELVISDNLLAPCSLRSFERQIRYHEPASLKFLDEVVPLVIDQSSIETLLDSCSIWKTRSWLKYCFKIFWEYVTFQKTHLRSESMTLCSLLMKFPNLRKATLYKLDDITKSISWADVSKEVFPNAEDCFSLHNWTSTMIDNLSIFAHLMLNCGRLMDRLASLEIDFVASETWQLAGIYEAWSKLRILKLHAGCDNTRQARSMVAQGLAIVIQRIPLVTELRISIVPSCGYLSRIDFHHVFCNSSQLTNLQILGIQTGMIDQRNLLALYQRHRDTLHTLTICDFHLSNGTWQEVLAQFSDNADRCNFILEALTDGDGWNIETVIPFCHRLRL